MTWNHRVMRSVKDGETNFTIREVFYDRPFDDEDPGIWGWTQDPIEPFGETLDELRTCLERMLACLDQPVLDEQELERQAAMRDRGVEKG